MLASSFGGHETPRVEAGRQPDDTAEVAVELALVIEADRLGGLGDEHAIAEQLSGARDPEVRQVLVRRQPDL